MSRRDAYAAFLQSADLATWRQSLDVYQQPAGASSTSSPLSDRELADALCLSTYVQWLSGLCGERQIQEETARAHKQLIEKAAQRRRTGDAQSRALLWAVAAASGTYAKTALDILDGAAATVPVEIALMVLPDLPAKRAQQLNRYVASAGSQPFLPAIYFYAHALIDLGRFKEVENLLDTLPQHRFNPMILDLRGTIAELKGAWSDALDAYQPPGQDSQWPVHKYRASICKAIVSGGRDQGSRRPQVRDEKLRLGMLAFGSEVDQTQTARSAAFVNACRWHEFDDWLVDFELGKLSFQRRRHGEADRWLKVAAHRAPPDFVFEIQSLRFVNMTWLDDHSIVRDLPVRPEVLECGFEALACADDGAHADDIRTFVASVTGDLEVLRPVAASTDAYERGAYHLLRHETPAAIRAWCESIQQAYHPRTIHKLIDFFNACHFEHTTWYLIDLVIRESWDNFFHLWELGKVVLRLLATGERRHAMPHLEAQFAVLEMRIEELSQSDFQHAIRAVEFYASYQRSDIAAALLTRAHRLAESSEERLQLAMAQRELSAGQADPRVAARLDEAERESRDRLERLQIAREWARNGRTQRARNILNVEGVIGGTQRFEPIEYIVALQCGSPCLATKELEELGRQAEAALYRDLRAGAFPRGATTFFQRLHEHAAVVTVPAATAAADADEANDSDSGWQSFTRSLERSKHLTDLEEERRLLNENLAAVTRDEFVTYALWDYAFKDLQALQDAVQGVRPPLEPGQTPISRSESVAGGARARQVSELWRAYLAEASEDGANRQRSWDAIRDFERDERALEREWQRLREQEQHAHAGRLALLVESAREVLAAIAETEQTRSPWPFFLDLRARILQDIETLRGELARSLEVSGASPC
jgi:hypothetical protein